MCYHFKRGGGVILAMQIPRVVECLGERAGGVRYKKL